MARLAIFYHEFQDSENRYLEISDHIMDRLFETGLHTEADFVTVLESRRADLYEFPTLELIRSFAIHHQEYYILYLHTKGVTRCEPTMFDWRECMLYWMVNRWKENVQKLSEGFDCVGINYMTTPMPHFQGNFWWATSKYISLLVPPRDIVNLADPMFSERHKAEMWLLSNYQVKIHSPYHHQINPYMSFNPKENYVRNTNS